MEALGINPIYLIAQILNFLVIWFLLSRFVFPRVLKALEERRALIEKGLEDAKAAEQLRASMQAERQRILEEALAERQRIVAEAVRQAEQQRAQILSEARVEAQRILEVAREEAERERERVLGELRNQIAALALAAAHRVVGDALDESRHRRLIQEFFTAIPPKALDELRGLKGERVEVISALPLQEEEKARIRQELAARLDSLGEIVFRVDPTILGGLILRVGDRVVDGSVRARMEGLRAALIG
ncbi:F0F1 ATP synthase subunit B [Thermoflexus hugenholtzii]|uniref:Multifunctional fusion protein n=1 Tax=Thermoflexus hugenholtzii JAD2 TaxID=877466 RepID=A0A212Q025_9CHLR|nr:F0F1 ATP synthase subunit B [Thermoflexus hugenholtzii]SNB52564.1 F-type H+-transporting ATPase subunit b [Thermoflexus hugenholtzii JAD2]